ncbi:MAG: TonB-dependent receptor [Bacteroidota bacterium]
MKYTLIIALFLFSATVSWAQSGLKVIVKDSASGEVLIGATVSMANNNHIGAIANAGGYAIIKGLPRGTSDLVIRNLGYSSKTISITIPYADSAKGLLVLLAAEAEKTEEVIITSARTNSRLEDLPMKTEVLGEEDMLEEAAVVPGNVASILGDISIIHIQKLSPVNGNQGIRMQGLDTKYTQILRDGLPLYEGFAGNLGVLQIPPLDLKQVEIIKGSVSTLYGGGAIGGLVNIVSKTPGEKPTATFVLNRSNLKETNFNAYYSQRFGRAGMSVFAGVTNQEAVDVNKDGFSDSPLIKQLSFHPRFFYEFSPVTKINIGYALVAEERAGGDLTALKGTDSLHRYFNKNTVLRHTADFNIQHNTGRHAITLKGTGSFFDRQTNDSGYIFKGRQVSVFTEFSDRLKLGKHLLVFGGNYSSEAFTKAAVTISPIGNFTYSTMGIFVQDNWNMTEKLTLQPGIRFDRHNTFGNFLLPDLAAVYKFNSTYTLRVNAGAGYKTPNAFSLLTPIDAHVKSGIQYLLPVSNTIRAERSTGLNADLGFKKVLWEEFVIQLDQALFYTKISNPVIARSNSLGNTEFINAAFDVNTMGTDTYVRTSYGMTELYLGYNHTLARRNGTGEHSYLPFAPQDKVSVTVAYTIPDKWRFGTEASRVGQQYIYNNQRVPDYWFFAMMVERQFGPLHIVLNCENLFDIKQSNYEKTVTGTIQHPNFSSIWAPQEGRIVNLALKYNLFN